MTTNILYTTPLTTSLYKQHKSQSASSRRLEPLQRRSWLVLWLEAIFYTETQHLSPRCCPRLTEPPPQLLISPFKGARWSDGKSPPFPELGTLEGGSQGRLQLLFPRAPGSYKAGCKQAPLKKNVNEGAIHYLRLAPCHPLFLWATAASRNRESIWWELGNPGGLEPLQSSFFSSAEDPAGSAFLARRTAELFTSFLTKHQSSSASMFAPRVFVHNPTQKSRLALYSHL